MFFKKKKNTRKKIDKLVTGLIIGGAVAGIIGLSKTKKGKQIKDDLENTSKGFLDEAKKKYGKIIINTIKFFKKK